MATDLDKVLFDEFAENYEEACHQGLALTGESRDYYARRRVELLGSIGSSNRPIKSIVDFGCGLGHTAPLLAASFPDATILGIDPEPKTIRRARLTYGSDRIAFGQDFPEDQVETVDLVYCNGVFHHIAPAERPPHLARILQWLRPGGCFALWENNPWNPGTRLVMRRIPFDRDAVLVTALEAKRMLRTAGFHVESARFHFYFPAFLRALRPMEGAFTRVPFGGQYCVLATKPNRVCR